MIDARIATNLLLVLRPEIERAQALLEAAQALQEIARTRRPCRLKSKARRQASISQRRHLCRDDDCAKGRGGSAWAAAGGS